LLAPLEGERLSEDIGRTQYAHILHAWSEDQLYDEALTLPKRFPPAGLTPCEVDALLLQAIPRDAEQSSTLQERMIASCPPAQLSVEAVLSLADALGTHDLEAALALLERHTQQVSLPDRQADTLTIHRARLLAQLQREDEAAALLRELTRNSSDDWVVGEATSVLIGEVLAADESVSPVVAETAAREALNRVDPEGSAAQQIYRALIQFHTSRSRLPDAIRWQEKLLEATPDP